MEIWHNPRCSKSREALGILEDAGVDHDVRRYLDEPPTPERLDEVLSLLGLEPWQLVRTGEQEYGDLGMGAWERGPGDRDRWVRAMAANPRLIERPVVIDGDRAVVGRPPQAVHELLAR